MSLNKNDDYEYNLIEIDNIEIPKNLFDESN